MDARLFERHEVLLEMVAQPECVNVEIRDDNGLREIGPFFGFEPGNDFGGEEVSTDRNFRLVRFKQLNKRARIQFVKGESEALILPRLVESIIEPAQQRWRLVHDIDVGFGVELTKDVCRVFQRVHMTYLSGAGRFQKGT